jgi:FAD/FMN-containing dehydrogenase/Fe-S oxidoreductase
MTSTQQLSTLAAANCEMAFDNLTRQLYGTDASLYQVEPVAVAFPKGVKQTIAVIEAATHAGISVTPRGAGTGLTGGAIGDGLIIDFARYNRQITDLDVEQRTVRVGAGVVLDQLNLFLRPYGFCFGPDVATSSRATLGGMIANNSSGAHALVYGTTADHLKELEIVLSNGRFVRVGPEHSALPQQRELIESLVSLNHLRIQEQFPAGLLKRWPGYGLDRLLREPNNLINVIAGSEGTLAAVVSAVVKIVPTPDELGLCLIFFDSTAEAMQAAMEIQDLKPTAVEHMDRLLLNQTRGKREFQAARDLIEFDTQPCASVLAVEFYEDVEDRLAALQKRKLGARSKVLQTLAEINHLWALRKAGLSLLTSRKGDAKPVTGVEDTAVRPRDLPAYYAGLQDLLRKIGLEASYYGHAATGLLHVRPILDLHSAEDLRKFRQVAEEVAALVRQFKGSFAAEHGVGIARTEFVKGQVGDDLYELMQEIKNSFDPHNLFNPGKIVGDGRYRLDTRLRLTPGHPLKLPFEPVLAYAARDESFVGNLEQCNGCGACRKETPTMCPTFIATGQEVMSTRGRANAIRAALEGRGVTGDDPLIAPELAIALESCLSCKACLSECPSNVNLALLKAELQYARIRRDGLGLRERLFGAVDKLGRWGCRMPGLANAALSSFLVRHFLEWGLGITSRRPLPPYSRVRFDQWFAQRQIIKPPTRGRVILWDDTFVRYFEPQIGIAAVKVLEAAGFEVVLPAGRECCGRPAFSQGNLAKAARLGKHNLALLNADADNTPILFLEPSCQSMFAEDYREMRLESAEAVARRCWQMEEFLDDLLRREPDALHFQLVPEYIAIHAHCHTKALTNPAYLHRVMMRLTDRKVTFLNSGCCGMAGSFGLLEDKYDLSVEVAKPLVEKIHALPYGTLLVTAGASCRQQIAHLTRTRARHVVEVLAEALV